MNKSTIIFGNTNMPLSVIDSINRKKISKNVENLKTLSTA